MKATLLCVLLCLIWSLVEVQSQTEYPYMSFKGTTLPNHSYVDLSLLGDRSGTKYNNTLQCHTNLEACCRLQPNGIPGRGDWFAPGNDTRLPFGNDPGDIYEDRRHQVVHLKRRRSAYVSSGIYRCVIPTNAVHNDSDPSVGETVYVGLYYGSRGGTLFFLLLCTCMQGFI